MRKTKIVATLGPASRSPAMLTRLIEAGVDVVRLNCSHASPDDLRRDVALIRQLTGQRDRPVAILLDLQGPKIRTGKLVDGGPVELRAGATVTITIDDLPGTAERLATSYQALPRDVKSGDTILLSDGNLELTVRQTGEREVVCGVVRGGWLKERQGINLPGVPLTTPALTDKDLADLRLGLELGVDYVALSFVRDPDDIHLLRARIRELGHQTPIVAKLEKPQAIACLEEIVRATDAIMVARGDLGVEMRPERVPMIQKRAIALANRYGKPAITATQMLESMIANGVPTRAEASDVANAILDGTDAVMLSGETSIGRFPEEAVRVMHRIAIETEAHLQALAPHSDTPAALLGQTTDPRQLATLALADAACHLAQGLQAAGIVPFTITGATALAVAKRRPATPIHLLTPDLTTWRRAALWWGVQPLRLAPFDATDAMIEQGETALLAAGRARLGDTMICIAGASTHTPGGTNLLKIHHFDGINPYRQVSAKETP